MLKTSTFALAAALTVATVSGCAGTPAAPFDQLKTANLTAYRLAEPTSTAGARRRRDARRARRGCRSRACRRR